VRHGPDFPAQLLRASATSRCAFDLMLALKVLSLLRAVDMDRTTRGVLQPA